MDYSLKFLQLLLVIAANAVVFTAAMTCDKMIWNKHQTRGTGVTDVVMEMGQYKIRTTKKTRSTKIQDLIKTLDGASNFQNRSKSFTAVLQPSDLKKV